MRRPSGMTLVEVMVASSIGTLSILLALQLFIPAMRAWADGQKRSEVSQSLLVSSSWVGEDISRLVPDSASFSQEERVLVMRCALGMFDEDGSELHELVAYWAEEDELYRAAGEITTPGAASPVVTREQARAMSERRRVAHGLRTAKVRLSQAWRMDSHLKVEKLDRSGELLTGYSSIYAPLDLEIASRGSAAETWHSFLAEEP